MMRIILVVSLLLTLATNWYAFDNKIDEGKQFIISSYCLTSKMANGKRPYYGVISADTRILPLGTIVEILGRRFIVSDTGSAIKGNRIDLWLPSCKQSIAWGRRKLKVRVIK